jgi:quercetin dioxygenase-like cupin family protein
MRLMTSAALLLTTATAAAAQPPAGPRTASPPGIRWGPAPAVFPPGAQMAVLQGDPGGTAPFTVRLRFPDGYRIAPHTHPTDEHVTVISGTFRVGMGATFDPKGMSTLSAGGFVTAPANQAHYAVAQGATVIQVHALGPFALTYVNPADTPRAGASRTEPPARPRGRAGSPPEERAVGGHARSGLVAR